MAARPRRRRRSRRPDAARRRPLRRPALRSRARPPLRRARDARRRRAGTARTSWSTSWWRSRSTGRTAPAGVLVAGPDFVAAPRPSPDGSHAGLARVGPAGHALGLDPPPRRGRPAPTGRSARRGPSPAAPAISIVQPAWRADGVLHFVSDESAWWNLYALDGEGGLDGPARNLAPMEAELGDPAWVFGAVVVRVHRRRRDPRRGPRRRSRRAPADHGGRRGLAGRGRGLDVHRGRGPPGRVPGRRC